MAERPGYSEASGNIEPQKQTVRALERRAKQLVGRGFMRYGKFRVGDKTGWIQRSSHPGFFPINSNIPVGWERSAIYTITDNKPVKHPSGQEVYPYRQISVVRGSSTPMLTFGEEYTNDMGFPRQRKIQTIKASEEDLQQMLTSFADVTPDDKIDFFGDNRTQAEKSEDKKTAEVIRAEAERLFRAAKKKGLLYEIDFLTIKQATLQTDERLIRITDLGLNGMINVEIIYGEQGYPNPNNPSFQIIPGRKYELSGRERNDNRLRIINTYHQKDAQGHFAADPFAVTIPPTSELIQSMFDAKKANEDIATDQERKDFLTLLLSLEEKHVVQNTK